MYTRILPLLSALVLLLPPSHAFNSDPLPKPALGAAGIPPAILRPSRPLLESGSSRIQLEGFVQGLELNSLRISPSTGADFDIKDIDRDRIGFRAAFGKPQVRGYFQFFGEDWDGLFSSNSESEMLGVGGGVMGEPTLSSHKDGNVRVVLPYRGGLNLAWGDDTTGVVDQDMLYAEMEGEFGIGVSLWGVRPMAGVYASTVSGTLALSGTSSDTDFSGTNAGGFLDVRYKKDGFPLYGSLRFQSGEASGLAVTFGGEF
jgi:hypothetical protein